MPANICLWCNKDFLATCEGLCLPCGDKMQAMEKPDLIVALAKAVSRVKELEGEVETWKAIAKDPWSLLRSERES